MVGFVSPGVSGGADGVTWLIRRENWTVGYKAAERKEFKLRYCEALKAKAFLQYRMILEYESGSGYMDQKMEVFSVHIKRQTTRVSRKRN